MCLLSSVIGRANRFAQVHQREQHHHAHGEDVRCRRHILIFQAGELVVHEVLQGINRVGRVRAADEVDFLEDFERIHPRQHEHKERRRHNLREGDAERLRPPARAFQCRVFIQRGMHRRQRRREQHNREPDVLPDIQQHNRHAECVTLQPQHALHPQRRHHAVDNAAVVEHQRPNQQHGRGRHQVWQQQNVSECR